MRRHTTLKIGGPADAFAEPASPARGRGACALVRAAACRSRSSAAARTCSSATAACAASCSAPAGCARPRARAAADDPRRGRRVDRQGAVARAQERSRRRRVPRRRARLDRRRHDHERRHVPRRAQGRHHARSTACGSPTASCIRRDQRRVRLSLPPQRSAGERGRRRRRARSCGRARAPRSRPTVKSLRKRRAEREPKKVASNGSTFKNPPNDFAGRLIEARRLQGLARGRRGVLAGPRQLARQHRAAPPPSQLLALIARVRAEVVRGPRRRRSSSRSRSSATTELLHICRIRSMVLGSTCSFVAMSFRR